MSLIKSLIGAGVATLLNLSASHAAVFSFNYSTLLGIDGSITATGTLTTGTTTFGPFDVITGISGTVNGVKIDQLATSPIGIPTNGLVYFGPKAFLTDFSFDAANGLTYEIGNLFDIVLGLPPVLAYAASTAPNLTVGLLKVSAVPVPASLPMFGSAILILGVFRSRTGKVMATAKTPA